MTDKFTPGPWESERHYVIDKDRWTVAHCYRAACVSSDGEAEANANLIAASPDLLALVESVEWALVPGCAPRSRCPWCKACEVDGHADDCAREAAIAKARGGSE